MTKNVIYSAIYGDYDDLCEPIEQSIPIDFILYTDNKKLLEKETKWKVVYLPLDLGHPRMNAKWPKLQPHHGLFLNDRYEKSIWVDGDMEITSSEFAKTCLDYLTPTGFTVIEHWLGRDDIYQELEASMVMEKYKDTKGREQVEAYQKMGIPEHSGLYACTTLIREHNKLGVQSVDDAWWLENMQWTYMDQLSFPYVCWVLGFKPDVMPYHVWRPMFNLYHHKSVL